MSTTGNNLLFLLSIMLQCVVLQCNPQNKNYIACLIWIENSENSKIINSVENLKLFECEEISWSRWDLVQWKRRRRMSDSFVEKIKGDGDVEEILRTDVEEREYMSDVNETLNNSTNMIEIFKQLWPVSAWRRYGLFTDDYLLMVNPHWLHIPPPHPITQYSLGAVYIVITSIGSFGNVLVMIMYFKCRTLRTPGNILVANLALSDFIMLAKTPIFIFNSFNLGPALGKSGCVIYGFVGGLTGTTSIATLSAIALDRYWAVVRPLEPLRTLTAIRARLMAISAWIYAGIFSVIPALDIGYGHYVPEGFLTSCSYDYLTEELKPRYFIFVFFCAAWLAPFCTITFCYINIFRVVVCNRHITSKNHEQRLSSRHIKERTKRKAEIKLAFLVMAVIVLFFVSWTPYAIVTLLGIFGKKELIKPITSMIPALFCKTAACINPFIYIITHPKFRKEFKKLLYRDKSRRMSSTMKTIGYRTETTKIHRSSKDLSDTEVEIIEMKDIPFQNDDDSPNNDGILRTVSSRITKREGSQKSMKSFEENIVSPPSWYCQPQFAKKSFQRRSTRSTFSLRSNPNT